MNVCMQVFIKVCVCVLAAAVSACFHRMQIKITACAVCIDKMRCTVTMISIVIIDLSVYI